MFEKRLFYSAPFFPPSFQRKAVWQDQPGEDVTIHTKRSLKYAVVNIKPQHAKLLAHRQNTWRNGITAVSIVFVARKVTVRIF